VWFGNEIEIGASRVTISDNVFVRLNDLSSIVVHMVSKSPIPPPSFNWTRLLILDAGTREPRMQRLAASTMSRLMRAFTNPLTTE
jgi:hypothetical protein